MIKSEAADAFLAAEFCAYDDVLCVHFQFGVCVRGLCHDL